MQIRQPNLFMRDDTFLGVCEALGEDLGFDANILRVALGVGILWNPTAVVGTYAALAVLVVFTRLIAPNPRIGTTPRQADPAAQVKHVEEPIAAETANQVPSEELAAAA